jgi:hypothetical protein
MKCPGPCALTPPPTSAGPCHMLAVACQRIAPSPTQALSPTHRLEFSTSVLCFSSNRRLVVRIDHLGDFLHEGLRWHVALSHDAAVKSCPSIPLLSRCVLRIVNDTWLSLYAFSSLELLGGFSSFPAHMLQGHSLLRMDCPFAVGQLLSGRVCSVMTAKKDSKASAMHLVALK